MRDTSRAILKMAATLHQQFDKVETKMRGWKEHALNCEAAVTELGDRDAIPERPWNIRDED